MQGEQHIGGADGAGPGVGFLRSLFGGNTDNTGLWQDREIRFDNHSNLLALIPGECALDSVNDVEDTKGNNGEKGVLIITSLRLLWISEKSKRTNLSVGMNCVINLSMKAINSRLKGNTQAIYCLTKFNGSRFEFIFTSLVDNGPQLFNRVQSAFRMYDMSRLYRDLKLRGNIIHDKELKLLPMEELYTKVSGIWNLSSEQGNLGTFFISNVRVVWHANLAPNFNVSIPYIQIQSVRARDSKFGQALVIETTPSSGSYILGFKVDPPPKMAEVEKEIQALFQVYTTNPNYGIWPNSEDEIAASNAAKSASLLKFDDDISIIEGEGGNDVFSAYYADGAKARDLEPVYSPELGLAIEGLQDGVTVEQLWNVL
mmetsp:Transcript_8063/g.23100  ORF Transcript_8063/g.23100 Transcript_8063/m.23100 type:complete len:371 (-) Transcript_8063:344-1456(-)